MARPIGTLGTIPTLTVGGYVFTDLSNLIILVALANTGLFSTLRKVNANTGAGYTPSGGTAFHCKAYKSHNTGTVQNFGPLYGNTDVGFTSGSGPTSQIYEASGSSTNTATFVAQAGLTDHSTNFIIPNGKYMSAYLNYNGGLQAFGYEV